ncbi:MAG TPA: YggS family pyridoxal phosphate-dependent enzyme [Candidatus Hydrogenedentes bacterium]|nr:YggS family pyridoxal phosphate-dependent enzyme [Candidatus Hydrogenedentota bacterium]HOS03954.1 YggS family pyridoxal phosphate-dependent enzyme [Candidatus Hydrogenedentota bacterium]
MLTDTSFSRMERNLTRVRDHIETAALRAGRRPSDVRIIAVTKSVGLPEVHALWKLGVRDFAENRLDSARGKIAGFTFRPTWHMIGNVQRRKAREVVQLFDAIDAVDRPELALELEKRCAELGRTLPVLLEVNVSHEATKHGVGPEQLPGLLDAMAQCPHLRAEGLMTMAPFEADPEATRPVFATLRELAAQYGLHELSMGMTNDYQVAVEEGATQVRIGTALFEQ